MAEPSLTKTIECTNVGEAIKDFCTKTKLSRNIVDFALETYATFYKIGASEWKIISPQIMKNNKEMERLARSNAQIQQKYRINIVTRKLDFGIRLDVSFISDKYSTAIVATLKASSDFASTEEIATKLRTDLQKRMLINGILIGMFDKQMDEKLEEISEEIEQNFKLSKDEPITLCSFPKPTMPVNDDLILRYTEHDKADDKNYITKHGTFIGVDRDELLVEYILPQEGNCGRNYYGALIPVPPPQITHKPTFEPTKNIKVITDKTTTKYYAAFNGYIIINRDVLDVTDTIEVRSLSLKETGSITDTQDKDTKIKVVEQNAEFDGISSGVVVEADKVEVHGAVADGVMIHSKDVEIHGPTHRTSKIYAGKAMIGMLRGYLEGDDIHVKKLEGGIVSGKVIKVDEAFGGEITGEKVYVGLIIKDLTITASELIEIGFLKSENSTFVIDSTKETKKDNDAVVEDLPKKILGYTNLVENLRKEVKTKEGNLQRNYGDLPQKIIQLKKSGTPIPQSLSTSIAVYQRTIKEISAAQTDITRYSTEIGRLKKRIEEEQEKIFKSKVVNRGEWSGHSVVRFLTLAPKQTIEYHPLPNDRTIMLKKDAEGNFKISTSPNLPTDLLSDKS